MKKIILFTFVFLLAMSSVMAITVLSLDRIDFSSNVAEFNKPAFVLYGVENGGSESAIFSLSNFANEVEKDGYTLTGTGQISSEVTDYRLEYPLSTRRDVTVLQIVGSGHVNPFDRYSWCQNLLPSGEQGYVYWEVSRASYSCVSTTPIGKYATIGSATHNFRNEVKVTANGNTQPIVITESDRLGNVKYSPNDRVAVEFVSLSSSPQEVPSPSTEVGGYFDATQGTWWTVRQRSLSTFDQTLSREAMIGVLDFCGAFSSLQSCIDSKNQEAYNFISYSPYRTAYTQGSSSNGQLILQDNIFYKYPNMRIIIDAEWVGIFRPVGEPEILSFTMPSKMTEGETILLSSQVRNKATVDASFSYSISCNGLSVQPTNLQPFRDGETKTLQHSATGQVAGGCTSVSCTLTVKDSVAQVPVTRQATSQLCEANQCNFEGEQRCLSNQAQKCEIINGVLIWQNLKVCPEGCFLEDGFAQCRNPDPEDLVCGDGVCQGLESDVTSNLFCQADCSLPPPVCGDNICDSRERSGEFSCKADCPDVPPKEFNPLIIALVIGGLGLAGAIFFRLRQEGIIGK